MQTIRLPKPVRKMRRSDYEDWARAQDAERAHRARNRARRAADDAAAFLTTTEHHNGF